MKLKEKLPSPGKFTETTSMEIIIECKHDRVLVFMVITF